jgi:predicted unusual protein kinase regulating ubiquinone biosynthesis (AarF/ABC1/UbiB family)
VAVKVQRPGIRSQIVADMDALAGVAALLDRHTDVGNRLGLEAVVDQLRRGLLSELDYRQEARNLQVLAENLSDFRRIVVPRPVDDYTSERVLTSEYIRGEKVTRISPLTRLETDGAALAEELFRAYLWQILVDGFVHADPHPGNVFLTEDSRIALLDPGMVAHVAPRLQDRLLQLLLAVSEGRSEEAASVALRIGEPTPGFDEGRFRREVSAIVSRTRDASLENLQVGRVVLRMTRASSDCGVRVPAELALLGKTLLSLDRVGQVLDPGFDPTAALRRHAGSLMRARAAREASPGRFYSAVLDVKEFMERLPQRANRILETAARNELSLKVDAIEEQVLIDGFQKVANRITVGLILAALIVGAALMMRVETSFRILGYPGIAILCFLTAAAGGVWLILSIVLGDSGRRRR